MNAFLHRLARFNVVPDDSRRRPAQHCHTSQFGAVIADDDPGLAALEGELFEFAHHAYPAERSIDHRGQALAAEVVDDAPKAKTPAIAQRIRDEVDRPSLIDGRG